MARRLLRRWSEVRRLRKTSQFNTQGIGKLGALFQSTTIPALEQVVNFTEARHNVLAGNIANVDTPGYKARDLSVEDFQAIGPAPGRTAKLQR